MRRLGALGTLVWDRIWRPGATEPVEQWGGAAYSLASLSASCPSGWRIGPIIKVGLDREAAACEHLKSLPDLVLGPGIKAVPEMNNLVELRYRDSAERLELQIGGVPGWTWPEMEPLLPLFDALYVNFISGYEMDVETAKRIRAAFAGPIYVDLHSLFLGPPGTGSRRGRSLPHWDEWLSCFDVVQLNETELGLLTGAAAPSDAVVAKLLDYGPRLILVTLGERGVRYVVRDRLPDDAWEWRDAPLQHGRCAGAAPPPGGALPGDPTGCGDVWGSACFNGLLDGLPLELAIARAQRFAAIKILHPDTSMLHRRFRSAL